MSPTPCEGCGNPGAKTYSLDPERPLCGRCKLVPHARELREWEPRPIELVPGLGDPSWIIEHATRFVRTGAPPGSFLRAVLENRLCESVHAADEQNRANLLAIAAWVRERLPLIVRGEGRVDAWICAHERLRELEAKAEATSP